MINRGISTALVVFALVVPPVAKAATDSLCAPLRAFAASMGPGQKHELVFRTSWGRNFKDCPEERVFSAKRCEGFRYREAERVCAVLMEDASVEFGNVNAMRAIECLSPQTHFSDHARFERGEFLLMYGNERRGANITLSLESDQDVGGMALRIFAYGY